MNFIYVALGGAIGSIGRYAISLLPIKKIFPVLTLATNVIGAIAIGFVIGAVSLRDDISENMILFLKVGICGGFTTFSTFSAETIYLFENGKIAMGSIYVILSVILCLIGVYFGGILANKILG